MSITQIIENFLQIDKNGISINIVLFEKTPTFLFKLSVDLVNNIFCQEIKGKKKIELNQIKFHEKYFQIF